MRAWTASVAIALLFIASVYFLNHVGVSARQHGIAYAVEKGVPFRLLENSTDIYSLWKEREEYGRVVVHVGRYLHFIPVADTGSHEDISGFPVQTADHVGRYEERLGDENLLWVAMQSGIAREIYNVLPPPVFQEKLQVVADHDGVEISRDKIVTNLWGSRRTITSVIPVLKESVLLHIDATYFSDGEPAALMDMLERSGLRTDLLTLGLARDNPYVTDEERDRLREFAVMLGGSGDGE